MTILLHNALARPGTGLRWLLAGCIGVALAGCGSPQNDSESGSIPGPSKSKASGLVASNSTPALVNLPLSVFSTNVLEGRDPFFPDSTRRSLRPSSGSPAIIAKPSKPSSTFLKLTGLWPSKKRPLALINKTAIAPGEEANITVLVPNGPAVESHKLLIRCLEVRQNSVLISIDGEPGTKELILHSKL